ncbi:hypothetical protein [Actinomadura sp. WMMB 499]|uniref:hypothetical protein n=1 Tax=Actinomadura sp. WMMB 499 TaxID=1219491 RepID=UPI001248EE4E|nr:hypothetical protein [Actinomadura sp. WMMB 499]QFG20499.1 hypothetical protein F7P10_04290 [Actinomadura sp. WMMB 499]
MRARRYAAVPAAALPAGRGRDASPAPELDVARTIAGREAIRARARDEVIGGTSHVLEVAARRPDGREPLVHRATSGSEGRRAHHDFTVSTEGITKADLRYA